MKIRAKGRTRLESAVRQAAGSGAVLAALLLAGCGGSGGGSAPAAVNGVASVSPAPLHNESASGSFTMTSDDYGMQNATYLSATKSGSSLVLRAAVASSMTDPDYKTVSRIDIAEPGAIAAGGVYSLGEPTAGAPRFPGSVYFFNGHQSTLLQTVGGTISFTSCGSNPGDPISGSFRAVVLDGGDSAAPKATYTVSATFSFLSGGFGPLLPAPVPVPVAASSIYGANCASCHSLGSFDALKESAPDLALKGGKLNSLFVVGHKGITLADADIAALKVLINAN